MGSLSPRQDESEHLHVRAACPGGDVPRGHRRQDVRPGYAGPAGPKGCRVREGRRKLGGALRRYRLYIPDQPACRRPTRQVTQLRIGHRGRGKGGMELQPRQCHRRPSARPDVTATARSARRRLSKGGNPICGSPVRGSERTLGHGCEEERRN